MAPGAVPSLAPLRTIRELHRRTAADLGMGSREDIESLLSEMQQLLVGISIMQASLHYLLPTACALLNQDTLERMEASKVRRKQLLVSMSTCWQA